MGVQDLQQIFQYYDSLSPLSIITVLWTPVTGMEGNVFPIKCSLNI